MGALDDNIPVRSSAELCAYRRSVVSAGTSILLVVSFLLLMLSCDQVLADSNPEEWYLPSGPAIEAGNAFRLAACVDVDKALNAFSTGEARARIEALFSDLGAHLPSKDDALPWREFFKSSILCIAGMDMKAQLIGYYNPWSDMFLMSEWRRLAGQPPRMIDVRLLPGEVIRAPDIEPPVVPLPLWLRNPEVPPPLAVVLATDVTLKEFENRFRDLYSEVSPRDWTKRLAGPYLELNPGSTAEALTLQTALPTLGLIDFFHSQEEPSLAPFCKESFEKLERGGSKALLGALESKSKNATSPSSVPVKWMSSADLTAVVGGKGRRVFLFITAPQTPGEFVCLWFRENSGQPQLENLTTHSLRPDEEVIQQARKLVDPGGMQ